MFQKIRSLLWEKEVHHHFLPSTLAVGKPLRDPNLSPMTKDYIESVLSVTNLALAHGSSIFIPESHISEKKVLLEQYLQYRNVFLRFFSH